MAEAYKYSYFAVSIPEEFILHIGILTLRSMSHERTQSTGIFEHIQPRVPFPLSIAIPDNRQIRQTAAVFKQAASDPNVRAIILSARGKAFSAGLDRSLPFLPC